MLGVLWGCATSRGRSVAGETWKLSSTRGQCIRMIEAQGVTKMGVFGIEELNLDSGGFYALAFLPCLAGLFLCFHLLPGTWELRAGLGVSVLFSFLYEVDGLGEYPRTV